jgi:hypothetical protein
MDAPHSRKLLKATKQKKQKSPKPKTILDLDQFEFQDKTDRRLHVDRAETRTTA